MVRKCIRGESSKIVEMMRYGGDEEKRFRRKRIE